MQPLFRENLYRMQRAFPCNLRLPKRSDFAKRLGTCESPRLATMSEMSRHGGIDHRLQPHGVRAASDLCFSSVSHSATGASALTSSAMCVEYNGKSAVATSGMNADCTRGPSKWLIGRPQDRFRYRSDNVVYKTCART